MTIWKYVIVVVILLAFVMTLMLFEFIPSQKVLYSWKTKCLWNCHNSFYDASLFTKHPVLGRNKTILPDICVAFLSCRRVHHLRKSLKAIIAYFSRFEPTINYEIALLDNGSDKQTVTEILHNFPIDITVLRRENVGIAAGIDALFHGACRSPYILSLEDDWEARVNQWYPNVPVMAMSMHVLKNDPMVSEIWLRDWSNSPSMRRNLTNWVFAPKNVKLMNGQQIMYRKLGRSNNSVWGGYTNGASLKDSRKIFKVGYMGTSRGNRIVDFDGEGRYSKRVFDHGLTSAHLCLPTLHPEMKCHLINKTKEPITMKGLFAHLGDKARSSGHTDFNKL